MKLQYWVIKAEDRVELSKLVEAALVKGWQLLGGVAAIPHRAGSRDEDEPPFTLFQAVTFANDETGLPR